MQTWLHANNCVQHNSDGENLYWSVVVIISEHLDTKTNSKLTQGQESCPIPNIGWYKKWQVWTDGNQQRSQTMDKRKGRGYAMKLYEGVEIQSYLFLISVPDGSGQLHVTTTLILMKVPQYLLNRTGKSQCHASHYINYAILHSIQSGKDNKNGRNSTWNWQKN